MGRKANDNTHLKKIKEFLASEGRTLQQLAEDLSMQVPNITGYHFHSSMTSSGRKQKFLSPKFASDLVKLGGIPLHLIKDIIEDKVQEEISKDLNTLRHFETLDNLGLEDYLTRYANTVIEYISRAKERIWISEYIPGLDLYLRPSEAFLEAYDAAHKQIFIAIEDKISDGTIEYKRILHLPPNTVQEAKYYAMSHCRPETFEHLLRMRVNTTAKFKFYYDCAIRMNSYALIDDEYMIIEDFKVEREHGGKGIYQECFTVDEIHKGHLINKKFTHFVKEFKEYILREGRYGLDLNTLAEQIEAAIQHFTLKYENDPKLKYSEYLDWLNVKNEMLGPDLVQSEQKP